MTLAEIIETIDRQSESDVVYAARTNGEWHEQSLVMVIPIPETDESPEIQGMEYFLEIRLIKEAIEVAKQWSNQTNLELPRKVRAVIYYATQDAYIRLP